MLYITRQVIMNYKTYGYDQLFIVGPQGMGKSTYAMLVLYEIYNDWDAVLAHVNFDPAPAFARFKAAIKTRKRVPVEVFDDAGLHFSKYLIWSGEEGVKRTMLVSWLWNVIRSATAFCIFTSPSDDILRDLRQKSWVRAQPYAPHGRAKPYRVMRFYRLTWIAVGPKRYKRIEEEDAYRLDWIPSDVRAEYDDKRAAAIEQALEELDKYVPYGELYEREKERLEKELEYLKMYWLRPKKERKVLGEVEAR